MIEIKSNSTLLRKIKNITLIAFGENMTITYKKDNWSKSLYRLISVVSMRTKLSIFNAKREVWVSKISQKRFMWWFLCSISRIMSGLNHRSVKKHTSHSEAPIIIDCLIQTQRHSNFKLKSPIKTLHKLHLLDLSWLGEGFCSRRWKE